MVQFESNKFKKKMKFYFFFLDVDKNGYIDQSEIDIMAKVFFIKKITNKNSFLYSFSMYYEC